METSAARNAQAAKDWQRHAWLFLFIEGIIGLIFGGWFMMGVEPDPQYFLNVTGLAWEHFAAGKEGLVLYVTDSLRVTGSLFLWLGLSLMVISYTAFRRYERWSWYVLWYLPLFLAWSTWLLYVRGGNSWPLHVVLLIISLLGLFLPYRLFFPADPKRTEPQRTEDT